MDGEHMYGTVLDLLDVHGQQLGYVQLLKTLPDLDEGTLLPRVTAYKKDEPHYHPMVIPLTAIFPCPMYFMPPSWATDATAKDHNLREQRRVLKQLEEAKRKLRNVLDGDVALKGRAAPRRRRLQITNTQANPMINRVKALEKQHARLLRVAVAANQATLLVVDRTLRRSFHDLYDAVPPNVVAVVEDPATRQRRSTVFDYGVRVGDAHRNVAPDAAITDEGGKGDLALPDPQ